MGDAVIQVEHISKEYRAERGGRVLLGKRGFSDWIRGKRSERITVLDDIHFDVDAGESFGIIGANGSGKSTLLKIISGVTVPTTGDVTVRGRVASLLELGAGFHPMLTGRENIYLNAGILGMSHEEVDVVFDDIVNFSGIGQFIEQSVDTYSSGMFVRLGFAVAAFTDPDIFLIDEVLAVGDEAFQRKCRTRIGELIEQKKTILFVSHDLDLVNSLCQKVLLLDKGKMLLQDYSSKVIDYYLHQIVDDEIAEDTKQPTYTVESGKLRATFNQGQIRLSYDGEQITHGLQVYASMLIHRLWSDSNKLRWDSVEEENGRYRFTGISRRFPYVLIWEMEAVETEGIAIRLWIETSSDLLVEEFHTSVCLSTEYTHWETDHESEDFPALEPSLLDWVHLNKDYAPGRKLVATSDTLPTVRFESDMEDNPIRMTPVNADYYENARVLQALRPGEEGRIHLPKGRHQYFSGTIRVGNTAVSEE